MEKARNALRKYKDLPVPLRASLWFIVASVLQKGITFIVTPIYTRLLTTSEYGYYSLYATWLSVFSVFGSLNLSAGVFNNGMLKYEGRRHEFISSMQGLSTLTTSITGLLVFLSIGLFSNYIELDTITLICIFMAILFSQPYTYWTEYQRYNFQYRKLIVLTVSMAVIIPLFSILFIYVLPDRNHAVIFGYVVVQVTVGGVYYIYNLKKGKKLFNKQFWIYALRFNLPLIPHYLSYIILGQSDRIMINGFCGSDKLAIYSLAYNISLLINIVVNSINSVYTPWIYRKIKSGDTQTISRYSIYMLAFMAFITFAGVLIAPEIISFLGTSEYYEAQWVVPPVMLGCFYIMIYNFFAVIEFYYEKSVYVMLVTCTAALSNILLNLIFIPKYGFIAAAYTTLVSYLIMAVLNFILMLWFCRRNNLPILYNIKAITVIAFIVTIACLLLSRLYVTSLIRYLLLLLLFVLIIIKRNWLINVFRCMREKN